MLYQRLRFYLPIALLVLGILLHVLGGFASAWPLYLGAAVILLINLLLGTIRQAFQALQKGDLLLAERLLRQTRYPNMLARPYRAHYYFIEGMVRVQHRELDEGRESLEKAISTGLPRPTEQALAYLNLGHIYFVQKEYELSRDMLENAREVEVDDIKLRQRLNELDQALARVS